MTSPGACILIALGASAVWLGGSGAAHSGPCTSQIAQIEQQMNLTPPGPETGPTAPQAVGAQLHHQPTPGTVEHAEHKANADADAALDRARKADTAGDAAGCSAAIAEARRLYGLE
jgi:hypothetical protein